MTKRQTLPETLAYKTLEAVQPTFRVANDTERTVQTLEAEMANQTNRKQLITAN